MSDTTPSGGQGFVMPRGRRVISGQAFVAAHQLLAFRVLDASEALALKEGGWIIAEPADRYLADGGYVLRSGEVVRLRALWRAEDVELTRGDGLTETITLTELKEMVAARVVATPCANRIY